MVLFRLVHFCVSSKHDLFFGEEEECRWVLHRHFFASRIWFKGQVKVKAEERRCRGPRLEGMKTEGQVKVKRVRGLCECCFFQLMLNS